MNIHPSMGTHRWGQVDEYTNSSLREMMRRRNSRTGASLLAILLQDSTAYIVSVGNVLCFAVRGCEVELISQHPIDEFSGHATRAESWDPNIYQVSLGDRESITPAIGEFLSAIGDMIVICSDGFWRAVRPAEIITEIHRTEIVSSACENLVNLAMGRAGYDDVSLILARVCENELDGESQKMRNDTAGNISQSLRLIQAFKLD